MPLSQLDILRKLRTKREIHTYMTVMSQILLPGLKYTSLKFVQ